MEAIVRASLLKSQVAGLQGILSKKATIPILSQIRITATEDGDMVMAATDLDVSLVTRETVDILQSGSICLSGKKIASIAEALSGDDPVHLKLDYRTDKLEFLAGSFKSKLSGIDSEQFPEIARVEGVSVKIPAAVLYEGLRRTAFAVTEDEKRFTINGVLLVIENGELKIVSTDGIRLCLFKMMLCSGYLENLNFSCLIPIKAVRELTKILSNEIKVDEKAKVTITKGSHLEFDLGRKVLTAREVTGDFPSWEKVIPSEFISFAEVNAAKFLESLKRVGLLADNKSRRVELVFCSEKVLIKAESPEIGNSVEELGCTFGFLGDSVEKEDFENDCFKIAFDSKYLVDFFSIHKTKNVDQRVIWKFSSKNSQVLLMFEGEEQIFSYILVPLKN